LPPLRIPDEFRDALDRKEAKLAAAVARCVQKLGANPRTPGLQTHPVQGTRDPKVFEAYVDRKNRVTWCWDGGAIVLLAHCTHDVLKRPYGPSN
jgi:hypothetical protein